MFAVTAGAGIRQAAEQLKNEGRFLESHALQALALESAEGYAELIHRQIRDRWGFPDTPDMTMKDRFAAKYQASASHLDILHVPIWKISVSSST